MKQERVNLMRGASYLLPDPGGEVVRELLDQIENLQDALTDCVTELSYLIDQTKSPIGGSVSKAFVKGQAALESANNRLCLHRDM